MAHGLITGIDLQKSKSEDCLIFVSLVHNIWSRKCLLQYTILDTKKHYFNITFINNNLYHLSIM